MQKIVLFLLETLLMAAFLATGLAFQLAEQISLFFLCHEASRHQVRTFERLVLVLQVLPDARASKYFMKLMDFFVGATYRSRMPERPIAAGLGKEFNDFARDCGERIAKAEQSLRLLEGNGRPGRTGKLEAEVGNLSEWRWWVLGAGAASGTLLSTLAAPCLRPQMKQLALLGLALSVPAFAQDTLTSLGQNQHIFLRPGIYMVSNTITLETNASIRCDPVGDAPGPGIGTCIIQPNGPIASPIIALTGTNAVLMDVTVDGANVSTGPNILITGLRARLSNVTTERAGTHGIAIGTGTSNVAAGATFSKLMALSNHGDGINCKTSSDIFVQDGSQIENSGGNGITLINCAMAHVLGNDISGSGLDGISVSGDATAPVSAYNAMIEFNTFSQNAHNDIEIQGWDAQHSTYASLSNIISGNMFQGSSLHSAPSTWDAVKIQDSGYNVITGNNIQDPFGPPHQFKAGIEVISNGRELADVVTANSIQTSGTPAVLP